MKTIQLQIQDVDGKVVLKSNIKIGDRDKLIIQASQDISMEQLKHIYELTKEVLESENQNLLILPDNVSIKVLKVNNVNRRRRR